MSAKIIIHRSQRIHHVPIAFLAKSIKIHQNPNLPHRFCNFCRKSLQNPSIFPAAAITDGPLQVIAHHLQLHLFQVFQAAEQDLPNGLHINNVLLVKIGLGRLAIPSTIIYLLFVKGGCRQPPLFINQPMGIWDIYAAHGERR